MCRNMSVDAYQAAVALIAKEQIDVDCRRRRIKFTGRISGADIVLIALIAKDTLSLSNRKMI